MLRSVTQGQTAAYQQRIPTPTQIFRCILRHSGTRSLQSATIIESAVMDDLR